MTSNVPNEVTSRHPRQPKLEIEQPDGDPLFLRSHFAKTKIGTSDRTARRYNFDTVYVNGFPYVKCKKSLQIIGDKARRKNQPAKRRGSKSHR